VSMGAKCRPREAAKGVHFFRDRVPYNKHRSVLNGQSRTARMMRTGTFFYLRLIRSTGVCLNVSPNIAGFKHGACASGVARQEDCS
jgi:hypothetical protein